MSYLLRPDLNQVRLEVDSFLGRAVSLGGQYEKLPERFLDTLMTFLRIKGMEQAQRRRTGIGLGREKLETGIHQILVCVDLALEEASGGDLNAAVEILARGEFEELRKRGWTLAFARLEEMRRDATLVAGRREAALLGEFAAQVHAWARVVPETWDGTDLEGEVLMVDPQADHAALRQIRGRLDFLRSLPRKAVDELLGRESATSSFAGLLRRLILAVALGRESLIPDEEEIGQFQEEAFTDGALRPEMRAEICGQIGAHLEGQLADEETRSLIMSEVEEELDLLVAQGGEDLREWLLPPEDTTEEEIGDMLRQAEADAEAQNSAERDLEEIWEFEDLDEEDY